MVSVSVIMPVFDGKEFLQQSLPVLMERVPSELLEVIVVDDGSTDGSKEFARECGARVMDSGGTKLGPARARNIGVEEARGDVVLFVDADVIAHADAISRVIAIFADPQVTAVYGSYDTSPPARGYASQYMNLRHHFYHRGVLEDAGTFWSGLGAIRRDAYRNVGGFDVERFPRPSVEDIDLGQRLRAAGGRIRREPAIQGTHLKNWSLRGVIHTDITCRAIPWTKMMLSNPGAFTDLNVSSGERLKALIAGALFVSAVGAIPGLIPCWVPLLLLAVAALASSGLVALFAQRRGVVFALVGLLLHQLYYLYSATTFVACKVLFRKERASQ